MNRTFLETPIEYLKGVGPQRADVLKKELKVFTFEDLLSYFPFRYVDRTKFYKIRELTPDLPYVQIKGTIEEYDTVGKKGSQRLVALFKDETGYIELVWFKGAKWVTKSLKLGEECTVFGKPVIFKNRFNITHPEIEYASEKNEALPSSSLQAIYSTTEKLKSKGLESRGIARLMKTLISNCDNELPEILSNSITGNLKLISREEAIKNIHFPENTDLLAKAQFRLKFEELFFIQLGILRYKLNREKNIKGHVFSKVGDYLNKFYKEKLPFELTNAQKRVIKEIRADIGSSKQMNRLLQGDVGSGKTLVALMTMLIALDNDFQACLMAPTEVLANQHFETISKMLEGLNIKIALLTGSTKSAERKSILDKLNCGELQILLGTHALIEENVQFKNLGIVVIDEQHKFGVEQRAKLWKKNQIPPHILVMTATPIPRTLAMTFYGDLDKSVIDEMPPGRKTIKTIHIYDIEKFKVYKFMRDQINQGRQIYIVYPLIKESEKLDLKHLQEGYESLIKEFPLPKYAISCCHGQMKTKDKETEMERFAKGITNIMVATTVIEVGIDVANATAMVIESAERFGLSQLHQLRGRVGRGGEQSYCILISSPKLTNDAKIRMQTMTRTNDGFEIAEADLRLRGPGDMAGTQQSGIIDLKIADLIRDEKLISVSRNIASDVLSSDPQLQKEENRNIRKHFINLNKNKPNWSRIS
ncbi:MAG: ATP-dependent DNA helicase RecG [Bacteroidales bacterium]|nr:ATP-dependent DNA helicase RecG [Bacteroidales bacterium]